MSGVISIDRHLDEIAAAVAAEREACAKVADDCESGALNNAPWNACREAIAADIRARGSVAATPPPSQADVPNRGEVAGLDARATAANVARLEGMLAQEKAEYDNVSRQLDKALEELRAERRRGDALLASLEATVPKGQTWTPELQAGRLMRERDAARAERDHLSDLLREAKAEAEHQKQWAERWRTGHDHLLEHSEKPRSLFAIALAERDALQAECNHRAREMETYATERDAARAEVERLLKRVAELEARP